MSQIFTLAIKLVNPSIFDATLIIAGITVVVGVLFLLILVFNLFGRIMPVIDAKSKAFEEKMAKMKVERKAKRAAAKAAKKAAKSAEKATETNNEKSAEKAVQKPSAPAPVKASAPVPAPITEPGISGEVVAAIAAAVAMTEGPGAVVRSIKKKNVGGRNPWAQAANIENTRPF